jgi:hypothetical protein
LPILIELKNMMLFYNNYINLFDVKNYKYIKSKKNPKKNKYINKNLKNPI